MDQEILNALILPLLFSLAVGVYGFVRLPEKRGPLLLNLMLLQLVGVYGLHLEHSTTLFGLLSVHCAAVFIMLVRHLQTPEPLPQQHS